MTTDTPAETETSPGSEQNKKSVPFGNKVMHHTLKGTKNALHKGKTAVQGTVNTVKSTATAAVTTSAESLHLKSKKSRSHEPTTPTINDSTRSVTVIDAEERNHEIDIVKKKEALLDEKEALLEEKGALLDELATAPLHQSTKSESKFFPLSELFKKNREATLLHLSLILVTYPTYKYWDAVLHLPASLVLAWLFFGFAVGNFVSIHVAQPEHTEQDLPTTSARRPSFQPESFQNTDGLLKERSTSSLFSSRSQRALGFLSSRRDWRSTPSFINPSGLSASIKRWNCDPTRDQKHRQLMHLLLINKNLRKKRKLQDKLENEPTESVSPRDPGDSSANLKASMAIGNYSLADVDSFGDLENYTIEPFFQLRGMDVFLCEADGGVPETKVADHSWFVQHGLRATPTFVVNLLTQWGNILLYFSLPEWLKDWDSVKGNDQDSKDIKALKVSRNISCRTFFIRIAYSALTS